PFGRSIGQAHAGDLLRHRPRSHRRPCGAARRQSRRRRSGADAGAGHGALRRMVMKRLLYSLATTLMLPLAVLHLWLRSRRQPEYLQHVAELFARYPASTDERPLIWIPAVSVGETRAAETLIAALKRRYPEHR